MAEIQLSMREIDDKSLPKICLVCGGKSKLRLVTLWVEQNPLLG